MSETSPGMRAELPRSEPERREPKESDQLRKRYEYKDGEGRVIATANLELSADTKTQPFKTRTGKPAPVRKLLRFTLSYDRDGKTTEFDALSFAKRAGAEAYLPEERLEDYTFDARRSAVVVPPQESPLDFGAYLHELGHAAQRKEGRFGGLVQLRETHRPAIAANSDVEWRDTEAAVKAIAELLPETKPYVDDALAAVEKDGALRAFQSQRKELRKREDVANEQLSEVQQEIERIAKRLPKADKAERGYLEDALENATGRMERLYVAISDDAGKLHAIEQAEQDYLKKVGLLSLVSIPVKILERDATRRAFEWLRELREKEGLDLLGPITAPEAADTARILRGETSVENDATVVKTIVQDLKDALGSYRAQTRQVRLRKKSEKGGPKGPIPRLPTAEG